MSWEHDALWQKTKLYMQRAISEPDRGGALFPFWAALGLELLARATLAKVHPALLADPQEGSNLMYAFGYRISARPKSIPAKTLFDRCTVVVEDFTDSEKRFCLSMVDRRNEELHTGAAAFDDWRTALWLADFFRACSLLLASQGRSLEDLFGKGEADAAETMIKQAEKETIARVLKAIDDAKKRFEGLPPEELEELKSSAAKLRVLTQYARYVRCLSCGHMRGRIDGQVIRVGNARLEEDVIYQDSAVLPTSFACSVCALFLKGHVELHVAGLGGQYTVTEEFDPQEYYAAGFDPADLYEPEYGND